MTIEILQLLVSGLATGAILATYARADVSQTVPKSAA